MLNYQLHCKLNDVYQIRAIQELCREDNKTRILETNYDGKDYYMGFMVNTQYEKQLLIHKLLFAIKVKEVW